MGTLNLLVLLSCILSTVPLTIAQSCSNNFTGKSTYGLKRKQILTSLANNVTANRGFYTATVPVPQDSETIYALALCRGDLTNQSCYDCVNSSSQGILANCANQIDVLDFGSTSHCIVRFSNKSFFTSMETQVARIVYVLANITENMYEFNKALNELVDELITRAAEGNSSLKFATGQKNYTQFKYENIVYGLMQCVPGLSSRDCTDCLREAVVYKMEYYYRWTYVNVLTPSCIFEYSLSPFVESSVGDAPPPSPSPPPATFAPPPPLAGKDDNTQPVIIIVVSTIGSVIIFIVCVCIFLRKWRKKKNSKSMVEGKLKMA